MMPMPKTTVHKKSHAVFREYYVRRSRKISAVKPKAKTESMGWPFASPDWSTVHQLLVPALTIRERLFLERSVMTKPVTELVSELGFEAAADIQMEDFLENYKKYYRFYPTLLTAEI